jgi:predicted DsbA family dithiol-disulfide isomerase
MNMPPIQPRTRLAHAIGKWAADNSGFAAYNYAVFKAFFQDGRDIGKLDILLQIVGELGLDPDELKSGTLPDSYLQQVILDEETAKKIGVRAVPAYVVNGKVLAAGVQSISQLQRLIFPD